MNNSGIRFNKDQLNRLFPFFILIDQNLIISEVGKSILKLNPNLVGRPFGDAFTVKRPTIQQLNFESLKSKEDQLLVLELTGISNPFSFRGQIEWIEEGNQLMYLGSPWVNSIDQLNENNLFIRDFSFHDPLIDLLHVLRIQEINAKELNELLQKVNNQKNELKAASLAIHDMSLFSMQSPDPLIRIDTEGNILLMNPAAVEMRSIYFNGNVMSQEQFWKQVGPQINTQSDRWQVEAMSGDQTYLFICKFLPETGYFNVYGRNISAEKAGQEGIRQLSLVASSNDNGVLFTDIDGKINWANKGFCTLSGYELNEVLGKTPIELLRGPQTQSTALKKLVEAFESGQNFLIDLMYYRKDGSIFWGRSKGQAVYNDAGQLIQYFALIEDITTERQNQDALIKSEERWQFALEGAGDGVWEYNFQTREVFFSHQYKKMLGFTDEEFQNEYESWISRVHPDDQQIIKETDRDYKSGFVHNHQREFRMKTASGQYLWILDRGMVVSRTPDGQPQRIIGTHTDITERKSTEQALQFKEEKYRNILANMNLGILEVDLEEKIQYANQSFLEMCGYDLADLLGMNARTFLVSGENDALMKEKVSLRQKGKSDAYEIAVRNKQGESRWWLVSGAPSYNDKGELVGSIGIHLDITEQKKLQDELLEARELAEASARAKELFLANMSHEIRTPMHAISGMSELLSKTKLIERQRFYLTVIQSASENMLVILNDILDLSKLEASKLSLESIGFNPKQVMEKARTVMQHRADEKGLLLKTPYIDPDIAPVLIGDPFRLNQIFFNLLSNAIKFTAKGKITMECHLEYQSNSHQTLRFQVSDTGIGMDQDFLERLFEKFSQEHQSTSRQFGGTGLGMNITKELVDLMGGDIEVKSEKGTGTVFTFRITFRKGKEQDLPVVKIEEVDKEIFKGLKILLVDDNDMNRLVANTMLENLGVRVMEAINGKQAVDFLMEESVDLILMDIQMPVMDGLEATREIKKQTHHQTPIIALTANALKTDNERYLQAGMAAALPKPFSENEIIDVISRIIGHHNSIKNPPSPDVETSETPLFDLTNLEYIADGNTVFIRKMIELFLDQTPTMVVQMKLALEQNDLTTLCGLAHKMRPSLENLGIVSLKEVVKTMEKAVELRVTDQELKELLGIMDDTLGKVFQALRSEDVN